MGAKARGITILLNDPAKTTPFKQVKVTGMSFTVELRSLDLTIVRYNPATKQFVPLANYPVILRLLTSNQTDSLSTNNDGFVNVGFPDSTVEVQLNAAAVPAGHKAVLTYPIKAQKRTSLTVVFIPDALRRYYPQLQFA